MDGISTITLTPDERTLLERIKLDPLACKDAAETRKNGALAEQLMKSLLGREAIPDHRLRYFTDPEYNIGGRSKSLYDGFVRNAGDRDAVLRHPHFLKYLKYFIFGADLPARIKLAFKDDVDACGMVTSGDIIPLGGKARAYARAAQLSPGEARDEFYKLALDCGLSISYARMIRDAAGKA